MSTDAVAPLDKSPIGPAGGDRNKPAVIHLPDDVVVEDTWLQGPRPLVDVPVPPSVAKLAVDGAAVVAAQAEDPLCQLLRAFICKGENNAMCLRHRRATTVETEIVQQCIHCESARRRFAREAEGYTIDEEGTVLRLPFLPTMRAQILVPPSWRRTFLEVYHDGWAHRGAPIVARRIASRFWWPGMTNAVHRFVKTCRHCQFAKAQRRPRVQHMVLESAHPGDLRQVDLFPMEPHRRGVHLFTGVIVDVDAFTKFPEIIMYTAADGQALEMAAQIIFAANGAPKRYLSDNGTVLGPKSLWGTFWRAKGTRMIYTGINHQSTNGGAERLGGIYKRLVYAMCDENHEPRAHWPFHHYKVLFALRTTIHAATGFSPAVLHYGRELLLPDELRLDLVLREPNEESISLYEYALSAARAAKDRITAVAEHRRLYNEKLLRYGTGREPTYVFQPGDKVLVWIITAKTSARIKGPRNGWTGPYVVQEIHSRGLLYTVRGEPSSNMHRSQSILVHVDLMIPFYDRPADVAEPRRQGRPPRAAPLRPRAIPTPLMELYP
eukprot:tig00000480_g1292.t1